jgi:hypothetical protein
MNHGRLMIRTFRRRLALLPCAAVFFMLFPSSLQAQRIDSPYRWIERGMSAGAFAGFISTGTGAIEIGPTNGPVAGGRFSIRLGGPFAGEAELGYMPTTRPVLEANLLDEEWEQIGEADVSIVMLQVALRLNLTGPRTIHGIQPFAIAGGGVARDFASVPEIAAEQADNVRYRFGTSFAGQFGVGAEWFVSEGLAIRGDARNVLWRNRYPEAFRTAAPEALLPEQEWVSNYLFGVGVSFYF